MHALTLLHAKEIGYGVPVGVIALGIVLAIVVIRRLLLRAVVLVVAVALGALVLWQRHEIKMDPGTCSAKFFWMHVQAEPDECAKIRSGG